jgi:predicted nucleic acid-binding protein
MIVVDSSGWLEFFTDGPLAEDYAVRLRNPSMIVTPTIILYEVYKRLKRDLSEEDAVTAAGALQRTRLVPLNEDLALTAADISLAHGLAMADAIVLATARMCRAELVTSDADFEGIDGVTYLAKRSRR